MTEQRAGGEDNISREGRVVEKDEGCERESIEPNASEDENQELGEGGTRGWRTERGRKFHHCRQRRCAASSRSRGNIDIFIFPLNLICVMDELPAL